MRKAIKNSKTSRKTRTLIKTFKNNNVINRKKEKPKTLKSVKMKPDVKKMEIDNMLKGIQTFSAIRITDKTKVDMPTPVITIGGELISTAGNITTISGPSKSGKSAFTSPIIAAALSKDGKIADQFEELYVKPNEDAKAVIHIDTEQASYKQKLNIISASKRAGNENFPENFFSYNFRLVELEQFKPATEYIFKMAHKAYNGIHLAIIDGIADYIESVNNAIQSDDIIKFFVQLAVKYKTTIIVIIHTNPGNDKERGHLGSQLQRKGQSVLTIRNEPGYSYVEAKHLRDAGKGNVPRIMFRYDEEKGYHVSCGILNEEENKVIERRQELIALAEKVFPLGISFKNKDAVQRIMKEAGRQIATAKNMFVEMKDLGLVKQNPDKSWSLNVDEDGEDLEADAEKK